MKAKETQAEQWARRTQVQPQQVAAWGAWLGGEWDWTWWLTMTFRQPVGERGANARWKAWAAWLNRALECEDCERKGRYPRCAREKGVSFELCRYRERGSARPEYVRFSELSRWRGDVPHFHALMILPWWLQDFPRDRAWEKAFSICGQSRIEPFDASRGASYYCTKYISKGANVLFSPGIGRVKRGERRGKGKGKEREREGKGRGKETVPLGKGEGKESYGFLG